MISVYIFPNVKWINKNNSISQDMQNFDQAIDFIKNIGRLLNFSESYTASIYADGEDISNIPEYLLFYIDLHNKYLNLGNSVTIFLTLKGNSIYEQIQGDDKRINIDYYQNADILINDFVYSYLDNKYYLVTGKLDEAFNALKLFGTDDPYEYNFGSCIPLYYLRKVSEKEIKSLKLNRLTDLFKLYNKQEKKEYYEVCEKLRKESPWL